MIRTVLIGVFFCFSVLAQEITGAFGIKFGESLDNLEVTGKSETASGEPLYIVKPRKPIKLLSHYVVGVTPISKKVYTIWGMEGGLSEEECKSRIEAVTKAIEKKYKIKRRKITLVFAQEGYYFTKKAKRIAVKCIDTFMEGHDFYVQYYDDSLEEQAKKEKIQLKSKEIDESGL